jgi:hypothetical protein
MMMLLLLIIGIGVVMILVVERYEYFLWMIRVETIVPLLILNQQPWPDWWKSWSTRPSTLRMVVVLRNVLVPLLFKARDIRQLLLIISTELYVERRCIMLQLHAIHLEFPYFSSMLFRRFLWMLIMHLIGHWCPSYIMVQWRQLAVQYINSVVEPYLNCYLFW